MKLSFIWTMLLLLMRCLNSYSHLLGNSHWGHIEGSSATVQSPRSRYSDSVIPNQVPHLKKWPSPHLNSQPQKYTQEDKCIMYKHWMDTLIPRESLGAEWNLFFLLLFCFVLHFCVGSQCVSLCLSTRDWMLKKLENTIQFATHFKCWGKALFSL